MNVEATGLRARKKKRTRDQIARAATDLVAEHGIQAVHVEDICDRAEIARATFFRYFDSKESAFVEGVHAGRLDTLLDAIAERPLSETPFETMRNAFLDLFQDWRIQRDTLIMEARIRASSPSVQAWSSANHLRWANAVANALAPRFRTPQQADLRAPLLAGVAMTAIRLTSERWLAAGASRSPAALLNATFDQLLVLDAP
jgi:AcrR family transcriptional regulator